MRKSSNQSPRKEARPHQQKVSKPYNPSKTQGVSSNVQDIIVLGNHELDKKRFRQEKKLQKQKLKEFKLQQDKQRLENLKFMFFFGSIITFFLVLGTALFIERVL